MCAGLYNGELIDYRKLDSNDFPSLLELIREFAEFEKMPEKMKNNLQRMLEEKEYIKGFVAVIDDQVIAYTTFFHTYHTWSGKCMYMDDLYVKAEFRHNGIGKTLLEMVIHESKLNKCCSLRWQVTDWNKKAQDFYRSVGAHIDNTEYNCLLKLN